MAHQQAQHRAAWIREVFERYEGPLVRYAAGLLGDVDRARDVVQDTFLRLCRQRTAKVRENVRAWLFTVCRRRRALDVLKKKGEVPARDELAERQPSGEPAPPEVVQEEELARWALAALRTLSQDQQDVVRLRFQNGFSYREISQITGLSESNVGYLLHTGHSQTPLARRPLRPRESSPHGSKRMNREADDPRLTAYALGESVGEQRRRIAHEAATDEPTRLAVDNTQRAAQQLKAALDAEPCPRLLEGQRRLVLEKIAAQATGAGRGIATALGQFLSGAVGTWIAAAAVAVASAAILVGAVRLWIGNEPAALSRRAAERTLPGQPEEDHPKDSDAIAAQIENAPHLVLHVGETAPLRITAVGERGNRWAVDPGAVTWPGPTYAEYIKIDPTAGTITGVAPTPQRLPLTVHFGPHTAMIVVEVKEATR